MLKIGILREEKIPTDLRVALTPSQCQFIIEKFGVSVVVQPSENRSYSNSEYQDLGIAMSEDLSDMDLLIGVKEVPVEKLIPNKKYLFFSHTIKKQPYNRELLQNILKKNIELVDYECIKDESGQRVVAFGRWAGIVGAYNALLGYGRKNDLYHLKPANQCFDLNEVYQELSKVKLPSVKILLTGGGRVAKGAQEILDFVGIKNISMPEYASVEYDEAIYIQLDSDAYNQRKDGVEFDFNEFYSSPDNYESTFHQYLECTDILIGGAYWDPKAPVLFKIDDINNENFRIRLVADITCDIKGSIPTTYRATTIKEPFFDIDRSTQKEVAAFSDKDHITVMSVDNLPCELPRDSSKAFGEMLIEHVMPQLLNGDNGMIGRATITKNGKLTEFFDYLSDYTKG